jgi:hypothetical protein
VRTNAPRRLQNYIKREPGLMKIMSKMAFRRCAATATGRCSSGGPAQSVLARYSRDGFAGGGLGLDEIARELGAGGGRAARRRRPAAGGGRRVAGGRERHLGGAGISALQQSTRRRLELYKKYAAQINDQAGGGGGTLRC